MAGLAVTLVVALFTSQGSFESAFNSFGASHGVTNAYQTAIKGAEEAGIPIGAGFSWSKTIPMIGAVSTVGLYAWFSSFMGGEIRQGSSTKVAHRNGIAAALIIGGIIVCAAIFFKAFGQDFLTAVYGNGLPEGLGTIPTYVYLTSVQIGSPVVAVILSLAFIGIFFMLIPYQVLAVTRYIFAWGFDGLLPKSATRLNSRGAPDVAVAIAIVLSLLVVYWSIFIASNLVQVVVYITLFNFISMGITAISAIVFPLRFPDQYRASSSNIRFAGIPLMVWSGLVSLGCIGFVTYLYFHYEFFGLADKTGLLWFIIGIVVASCALYFIPRIVRRREGIDLSLAYAEIPPE
jgi:amino acid transporter